MNIKPITEKHEEGLKTAAEARKLQNQADLEKYRQNLQSLDGFIRSKIIPIFEEAKKQLAEQGYPAKIFERNEGVGFPGATAKYFNQVEFRVSRTKNGDSMPAYIQVSWDHTVPSISLKILYDYRNLASEAGPYKIESFSSADMEIKVEEFLKKLFNGKGT